MRSSRSSHAGPFGILLFFCLLGPLANACELTVGWEPWPPFEFETADGQVSGLDGDLLATIAGEMNCTLTWVQTTWKRSLAAVESGEINLVMSASHTAERAVWGIYSESYRQSANHLVLGRDLQGKFDSLEAFLTDGKKLGIVKDYFYGEKVMEIIGADQYRKQVRDTLAANGNMKRLASGRVDGILMDAFVAKSLKRELGVEDKIAADSIEVSSHDLFVLFSKSSVEQQTVDEFNAVLARLKADGTIQRLFDQY